MTDNEKKLAELNAQREAELQKMIESGEIGLMTECAYGETIAKHCEENKKVIQK